MQKVEGSSPFIRLQKTPPKGGVFVLQGRLARRDAATTGYVTVNASFWPAA
jgi:hypothetical protein